MGEVSVSIGFCDDERVRIAELYWAAFGAKLGRVLGPEPKAMSFIPGLLNPACALVARDADGALIGVAGFKTDEGGLVEGGFSDLARVYGGFGALWRGLLLELLDRKLQSDVFQMDGILVDAQARGQGVGTLLLDAVVAEAVRRGRNWVELDVIDTNPRARALYERTGFEAIKQETTGPFQFVFGFASATRMRKRVSADQ